MLCRYYLMRFHFTAGYQSVVFFVLGLVGWGTKVEVPPLMFLAVVCVYGILPVILGLLVSPMYFPLPLNEARANARFRKKNLGQTLPSTEKNSSKHLTFLIRARGGSIVLLLLSLNSNNFCKLNRKLLCT
jgi:hypothetical protein